MKDKIIMFVIGVLVGAIIATGAFYIYTTVTDSCNCSSDNSQMNGGQPPEMPSGQGNENGQPPEKPDGDNNEPPAKPSEDNTQDNNDNNNNN